MKIIRRIVHDEFPFLCAMPAFLWQIIFLFFPLIAIACFSFFDFSRTPWYAIFTLSHYIHIIQFIYLKVILNSLILSLSTAMVTLMIAYPIAYFLALKVTRGRTLLLFLIILPSWTNIVVQVYAWFFLLERGGIVSSLLWYVGITSRSYSILNSYAATLIGMVYCFLPFMILPIYTVLEKMDKRLLEASADLGANWWNTFRRVIFPLSLPGVYVGLFLVSIPAFGEFVIPSLLGGGKQAYWGSVIVEKFLILRDWASGFALASLGIFSILCVIGFLYSIKAVKAYSKAVATKRLLSIENGK